MVELGEGVQGELVDAAISHFTSHAGVWLSHGCEAAVVSQNGTAEGRFFFSRQNIVYWQGETLQFGSSHGCSLEGVTALDASPGYWNVPQAVPNCTEPLAVPLSRCHQDLCVIHQPYTNPAWLLCALQVGAALLSSSLDLRPKPTSLLCSSESVTIELTEDPFFRPAPCRGAFAPGSNFLAGWSWLDATGSLYTENIAPATPPPAPPCIRGDIDLSGEVNENDLFYFNRYLLDDPGYPIPLWQISCTDVNNDGMLLASDIVWLSRSLAGWGGEYTLGVVQKLKAHVISNYHTATSLVSIMLARRWWSNPTQARNWLFFTACGCVPHVQRPRRQECLCAASCGCDLQCSCPKVTCPFDLD